MPTINYQDIVSRIKNVDKEASTKKAMGDQEAINGIKDPADKGTVSIPDHPEGDNNAAQQRPTDASQASGSPGGQAGEGQKLEDKNTNPVSTGKDVPSTTSGNAKEDAATAPNTPIDKIANQSKGILDAIASLSKKASDKKEEDAGKKEAGKKDEDAGKKAGDGNLDFEVTPEIFRKLAGAIFASEERAAQVSEWLKEDAGAEKAAELIAAAHKEASQYDEEMYKAAAYYGQLEAEWNALPKEDQEKIASIQNMLVKGAAQYKHEAEKVAFMGGAMDAGAMMDAEAGGEEPMIEGGAEGAPLGPEEILALLEQLVAAGEIPPEVAEQVAAELMAGEGGGEDPAMMGEDPAMMEGGGEMPMPEEMKMASALLSKFTK